MQLFSNSKPTKRDDDPLLQETNEPKKSCFTYFCYTLA